MLGTILIAVFIAAIVVLFWEFIISIIMFGVIFLLVLVVIVVAKGIMAG
jgi:hypothetical protein